MSNFLFYTFIGIIAAVGVVALGLILQGAEANKTRAQYTQGYCAALSGTVLNNDACNVNGRVVEVPSE